MRRNSTALAAIALVVSAAAPLGAQNANRQTKPLDPANLDRTANACVDFYQFANGGWIKNNPLPRRVGRHESGEPDQDSSG